MEPEPDERDAADWERLRHRDVHYPIHAAIEAFRDFHGVVYRELR